MVYKLQNYDKGVRKNNSHTKSSLKYLATIYHYQHKQITKVSNKSIVMGLLILGKSQFITNSTNAQLMKVLHDVNHIIQVTTTDLLLNTTVY